MFILLRCCKFIIPFLVIPDLQASDVTFNISGSIKYNPCTITTGANQNVELGTYNLNSFSSAGLISPPKLFEIKLDNCPSNSSIQVMFAGDALAENNNLIALQPGGAENVGIILYESDQKTVIPINSMSTPKDVLMGQENILKFYAAYMTTGIVTVGKSNANISFTISYN